MANPEEKNAIIGGTLYLVATPIGNMSDLSARAIKVLSQVDFIAAEDTRNSGMLLSRLGIEKPLYSYFEHNKREHGEKIAQRLKNGESCALITDAGTPAISDPGEDLVRLCADEGIPVTSIPGCCAAVTALTLSSLPTRRFCFEGFLPPLPKDRRAALSSLADEKRTMIFYEAPHRLVSCLEDFSEIFGADRRVSLCRELTKLNEEVCRTTFGEALRIYSEKTPRGEYVLVVDGAPEKAAADAYPASPADHVASLMEQGLGRMDAIKAAAKERGLSKGVFYQMLEDEKNK